jgi:diacylglycerol kinase
MKKLIARFTYAVAGIVHAIRHDRNFGLHLIGGSAVIIITAYVCGPLTLSEWQFLLLGLVMVVTTELQNSSLETALNHLHPERHDAVRDSKDMAAGAVLLSALVFLMAVLSVWIS